MHKKIIEKYVQKQTIMGGGCGKQTLPPFMIGLDPPNNCLFKQNNSSTNICLNKITLLLIYVITK